jgi:hypothetical protein
MKMKFDYFFHLKKNKSFERNEEFLFFFHFLLYHDMKNAMKIQVILILKKEINFKSHWNTFSKLNKISIQLFLWMFFLFLWIEVEIKWTNKTMIRRKKKLYFDINIYIIGIITIIFETVSERERKRYGQIFEVSM